MKSQSSNLYKKLDKNMYKSEKGSVSLYAMVSMLIILTILLSTYIYNSQRHSQSLDVTKQIKQTYERDIENQDFIYSELVGSGAGSGS